MYILSMISKAKICYISWFHTNILATKDLFFTTEDTYSIPEMPESPCPTIAEIKHHSCWPWSLLTLVWTGSWQGPSPDKISGYFWNLHLAKSHPCMLMHLFQQSVSVCWWCSIIIDTGLRHKQQTANWHWNTGPIW